ncbi:MAG: alpha/beta fold hydrolase [Candidatus Omnitrophica bacterium]|nr:alpha/beta fold hydrolase [Candidatus Omnitrophota bacterium]
MTARLKLFFIAFAALSLIGFFDAAFADNIQRSSGILYTSDNIEISCDHYRRGFDSVVIICPGFFNSKDNRWMRKTVDMLLGEYDVIIFDFRGHGKSAGKYTWSAKEKADVDTVVNYAISRGYKNIGILAFSLGAAAAVNDAAARNDIKSMVLISCPSAFNSIDYHFWEPGMWADLKDNIDSKWAGKGARTGSILLHKEDPINSIGGIKDAAILFINGDEDWVIKPWHSKTLYDKTNTYKKIEIIEGGFHAERLIQFHYDRMSRLILDWFSKTLR